MPRIDTFIGRSNNGYSQGKKLPDYRYCQGELKVYNPYRGWLPLHFGNPRDAKSYSRRATTQSIAELEKLCTGNVLYMPFPPEIEKSLMDGMEIPLQPQLRISSTQIVAIIERVRNMILEWSLSLEKRGILGEGMVFTPQEKEIAHSSVYHIGNFIESMTESQIQQDAQHSSQAYQKSIDVEAVRGILGELQKRRDELRLAAEDRLRLDELLDQVAHEINSPNPKTSIFRQSLSSIRSIIEGAAGSALFQGISIAIGALV